MLLILTSRSPQQVGVYTSTGAANGCIAYKGPHGGLYYVNKNGTRCSIRPDKASTSIEYLNE